MKTRAFLRLCQQLQNAACVCCKLLCFRHRYLCFYPCHISHVHSPHIHVDCKYTRCHISMASVRWITSTGRRYEISLVFRQRGIASHCERSARDRDVTNCRLCESCHRRDSAHFWLGLLNLWYYHWLLKLMFNFEQMRPMATLVCFITIGLHVHVHLCVQLARIQVSYLKNSH